MNLSCPPVAGSSVALAEEDSEGGWYCAHTAWRERKSQVFAAVRLVAAKAAAEVGPRRNGQADS